MKKVMQLDDNLYGIDSPFTFVEEIYVRSYLILGSDGGALIDGGIVGTEEQVLDLLDEFSMPQTKLRAVLISHAHADHVGAVGGLKNVTGCVTVLHREGAEMLRDKTLMYRDFMGAFPAQISVPEEMRAKWFAITGGAQNPDIQFGDEGITLDLGGVILNSIPTPGHSYDSVSYYEPNRRWLFTGDAVCGTGPFGEPPSYRDATVYRDSLVRLSQLSVDRLFPGHFEVLGRVEAKEFIDESLGLVDRVDSIVRDHLKSASEPLSLGEIGRHLAREIGREFMVQALFVAKAHVLELERLGLVGKFGSEDALYRWLA